MSPVALSEAERGVGVAVPELVRSRGPEAFGAVDELRVEAEAVGVLQEQSPADSLHALEVVDVVGEEASAPRLAAAEGFDVAGDLPADPSVEVGVRHEDVVLTSVIAQRDHRTPERRRDEDQAPRTDEFGEGVLAVVVAVAAAAAVARRGRGRRSRGIIHSRSVS